MDEINSFQKQKSPKNIIFAVATLFVLVVGLIAGLILVRQKQKIEEEAATPTGTVKLFLTPEIKTVEVGREFTVDIFLDTQNQIISALTIQLDYPYSGERPAISAKEIVINSSLITASNWNFPIKTITELAGKGQVKIGGFSGTQAGYKTNGKEKVATITFKANSAGTINVSFNASESKATSKSTSQDILLIPSSSGTYTATGGASSSPSPTSAGSPTPTPTLTSSPHASPTAIATLAPVPQSGVSLPTILATGMGTLLLLLSFGVLFW
jgi:hypothetical protein